MAKDENNNGDKGVANGSFSQSNQNLSTNTKHNNEKMSSWLVTFVLVIVWGFVGFSYYIGSNLLLNLGSDKTITTLDKTPMVFLSIIFIAATIFTDSFIKTLKYDTRPNDNIFSSLIQSLVMAFAMIWAFIKG